MYVRIKIQFTNNRRPAPEHLGAIAYNLTPINIEKGIYAIDKLFVDSQTTLDKYLQTINLHPCVNLAWLG